VVDFALKALRENPELSLASCFALVKQAHSAGELTVSRFPGRASFYRWMKTALQKEGAPTIGDFADRPRSGRPRVSWHPAVVDRFEELVLSQIHPSLPLLYKELVTWAEQQEPKLPVPSIAAVRSRYNSIDFAALSAARHGRRAARADAIVKGAVPAEYPHQIWTLDEMDAPNWIKALNPQTGRLESVRPKVILVIDNYSRVVLACHVCEPFKGGEATVSFDSEDVLGTVLAATFRELASEACKPFTGFLPGDVRMDAAKQHNRAKTELRKHGVGAKSLEVGAPWERGSIESLIGRFSDLCYDIAGHVQWSLPADRVNENQHRLRSVAAATTLRVKRKAIIAVEDLLSVPEYQDELERVVQRYNGTKHRALGTSPEVKYHNDLRTRVLRPAPDALSMMEPVTLTVGKTGIEHRNRKFMPVVAGVPLAVGTQVVCRPDPLRRGIFAKIDKTYYFFQEAVAWSRHQNSADVVREQKAIAASYSDAAEAALERQANERLRRQDRRTQIVGDTWFDRSVEEQDTEALDTPRVAAEPDAVVSGSRSSTQSTPRQTSGKRVARPKQRRTSTAKGATPASTTPELPDKPAPKRKLPRGVVRPRAPYLRVID
jgi:hypothetical protein